MTVVSASKHILIFDAGNTSIKLGLYKDAKIYSNCQFGWYELDEMNSYVQEQQQHNSIDSFIGICSGDISALPTVMQEACMNWNQFELPIATSYSSPHTLGQDRLAMSASAYLEHSEDLLVVTMGTCITYNIVKNASFLGGAISPGWQMRYLALHEFTAGLPLTEYSPQTKLLGDNTDASLRAGVDIAIEAEVSGMIERYCHQYDIKCVVLCGGDANRLSKPLKKYIFAPANYELHALKRIHEYFEKTGQL